MTNLWDSKREYERFTRLSNRTFLIWLIQLWTRIVYVYSWQIWCSVDALGHIYLHEHVIWYICFACMSIMFGEFGSASLQQSSTNLLHLQAIWTVHVHYSKNYQGVYNYTRVLFTFIHGFSKIHMQDNTWHNSELGGRMRLHAYCNMR